MTDDLKNNPFDSLRQVKLSGTEKETVRANLRAFVFMDRPRHWYGWFAHHVAATAVVLLLLSGSGVLWVADSAEPDSTFYGVRTSVNDKVRVSVAGDELQKIEKELELLGGYLEEEEMLIARELAL